MTTTLPKCLFLANDEFPFVDLLLNKPISVLGEANHFMIKTHLGNKTTPVYVQTPPCLLKDGTLTKVGKHTYMDFIFSNENSEFLIWIEKLEDYCQKQLIARQNDWFQTEFTEEDIETLFISPCKALKGKGGKMYSVRTNIPLSKQIKIFNEQKEELEFKDDFSTQDKVIAIIEMVGIKCSPRNFHIDLEVKQMMLLKENPFFSNCLITTPQVAEPVPEPLVSGRDKVEVVTTNSEPVPEPIQDESVSTSSTTSYDEMPLTSIDVSVLDDDEYNLTIKTSDEIFQENMDKAIEKVKTARHLGIMTFLKSHQYTFRNEILDF